MPVTAFRILIVWVAFLTSTHTLNADLFMDSLFDDTATVNGGGIGQNNTSDFFGVVTSTAPLQINGGPDNIVSGFTPALGDVIGRDLVSSGFNFTGDTISWTVNIPAVDPGYIAGTFDLSASFNAGVGFFGNAFGPTQPNALNFSLFFDGVSQDSFQAQSGVHLASALSGAFTDGAPVSIVEVVVTFPAGNSFDAGTEEFHVFADSLTLDYSFEFTAVPEPGSLGLLAMICFGGLVRRKKN